MGKVLQLMLVIFTLYRTERHDAWIALTVKNLDQSEGVFSDALKNKDMDGNSGQPASFDSPPQQET